ncbi:hypothetical protein SERLA73DRAFT_47846, partial [Serpula lacrymans var. lacrymans S7.3]
YRPRNPWELFNLCHVQAQNCIEQISGVLEWQFHILICPAEFLMEIQARIPAAHYMVHNFICLHNPNNINNYLDEDNEKPANADYGALASAPTSSQGCEEVNSLCNSIARKVWEEYQRVLGVRAGVTIDVPVPTYTLLFSYFYFYFSKSHDQSCDHLFSLVDLSFKFHSPL